MKGDEEVSYDFQILINKYWVLGNLLKDQIIINKIIFQLPTLLFL